METYTNTNGVECVVWTDENGMHSMTKEAYDAQQATNTLPSNSADPAEKPQK